MATMTPPLTRLQDVSPLIEPLAAAIRAASGYRGRSGMLTAAALAQGRAWDGQLMVIGRAPNGWDDGWSREEGTDHSWSTAHAVELLAPSRPDAAECPLAWVTEQAGRDRTPDGKPTYNTNRSNFWKAATAVRLAMVPPPSKPVPSTLVWTNLYPVAPAAGENPGVRLSAAQEAAAKALLRAEFELFRPRYSLWLTGMDWAEPFLSFLGVEGAKIAAPADCWAGQVVLGSRQCGVVVVQHPGRKRVEPIVSAALEGFRQVGAAV
jgi:hypothetical protein